MDVKEFMNSVGLSVDTNIHVTHRRDNGIHTVNIAELLESYHQHKLLEYSSEGG